MFTVAFQCHYLYIAPLRVDAFHEWGRGGWGGAGGVCLSHLHLSYCSHLFLHLLAPINTWKLILVFTVTQCVIHASSCAQLFIHTTHSLAVPLPLSTVRLSLSLCNSCKSWIWKWHRGMSGPPSVREFHFLSLLYIHVFPLMFFYFILFSVLFI